MLKIVFLGAGSTVFAKNILGDILLTPALSHCHIALYDIDGQRLRDSENIIRNLNNGINQSKSVITAHEGPQQRKEALKGASFVINAIQVGGYKPSTVIDFEIPKKYGLRQTIGDTLGVGGIFRGLRTIPVMRDIIKEMEEVCPEALLLNYTNPMAIVTGAILKSSSIKAVGLCHSVQNCAENLLDHLDMKVTDLNWKIAGINHMAWLLEVKDGQKDIYPEIRQKAAVMNKEKIHDDMVRFDMMARFGFYITESSEHLSEYTPYWIKRQYPNLIERFNIPLDEYPRRCESQITEWETQREEMVNNINLVHKKTTEFGSYILEAIITGNPYRIHGNILNNGLIPNLPAEAIMEIPCLVDKNGIQGCRVDPLPQVCAALNRTNINVQLLTIEAALEGSKDSLYQAAYLDPHTAAELSLEEIRNLCDDLIESHGDFLPKLT